ncbi:YybH family protein [Tautonia marina]|uniref:YybH family protein n=1 Tax=Tautonia marina TaxID=2653855 RepID=UPI00126052A4|nr:SgcJ/EcaC family oxidoreductase [Tautonia marina]
MKSLKSVFVVGVATLVIGGGAPVAAPPSGDDDHAAVRAVMESFVTAFNAADPKALAGHWTAQGEYIDEEGATIRGREALEEGFTAFFEGAPKAQAEVKSDALRFLSPNLAVDEGRVTVRFEDARGTTRAFYTALLAREEDQWRLASLHEMTDTGPSLEALDWLVGEWKSTDPAGTEIATRYSWNATKTFLTGHFTIEFGDRTLDGVQVIGIDPATGGIRSWTFEAEGGIGEADWEQDDPDHWVFVAEATLADGASLTATNILRRIDENTFTLQSVNRAIDEQELPDMPPVRVSRVTPEP